jgi:hypothetical protein
MSLTFIRRCRSIERAFMGYAYIVTMLLERDPSPPLTQENEFRGCPVHARIRGAMYGWQTGFPQDHGRTLTLLLRPTALTPSPWLWVAMESFYGTAGGGGANGAGTISTF